MYKSNNGMQHLEKSSGMQNYYGDVDKSGKNPKLKQKSSNNTV